MRTSILHFLGRLHFAHRNAIFSWNQLEPESALVPTALGRHQVHYPNKPVCCAALHLKLWYRKEQKVSKMNSNTSMPSPRLVGADLRKEMARTAKSTWSGADSKRPPSGDKWQSREVFISNKISLENKTKKHLSQQLVVICISDDNHWGRLIKRISCPPILLSTSKVTYSSSPCPQHF